MPEISGFNNIWVKHKIEVSNPKIHQCEHLVECQVRCNKKNQLSRKVVPFLRSYHIYYSISAKMSPPRFTERWTIVKTSSMLPN